jgi:hypothetical protein
MKILGQNIHRDDASAANFLDIRLLLRYIIYVASAIAAFNAFRTDPWTVHKWHRATGSAAYNLFSE